MEKEFICICGKKFNSRRSLGNHKKTCIVFNLAEYGNLDKYNEYRIKIENKNKNIQQQVQQKKDEKLRNWVNEQHKCKKCGKIMTEFFGTGVFCSRSCANSRIHTKEYNTHISNGIRKSNKINHSEQTTQGKYITKDGIIIERKCNLCGKHILHDNKSGYCLNCLRYAPELKEYRQNRGKYAGSCVKNRIPWKSRNLISYPEKFWMTVLNNNHIEYVHEYVVRNKKFWYFLDFYIVKNGKNIDLEVDGKQHEYSNRKEHDKQRDAYLTSNGYLIYRIKWNEINSEKGKQEMKSKINDFLDYYNSL